MDNGTIIISGAHNPPAAASDDTVRELTRQRHELTEAIERLIQFQRKTLVLKTAPNFESALDTMEALLIEVIDFAYASLRIRDGNGVFAPLRHLCPEGIPLDIPLMAWVMQKQEISVVPVDIPVSGESRLRSLVCLPFGTRHIMLLWLEQDVNAFTREQEALLSILSREMASVLDACDYRVQLEKTRAAMLDIIESVPLGILSVDHNGKVRMINSTAEIALDVRRRKAEGADYREALPPKLAELISEASGADAGTVEEEISIDRPGGEPQFLGVTVSPVRSGDGGDRPGQVLVCRNLQLVREVRKLRELDVMKSDFLSLVTHELRTPLTSIMAYSETLMLDDAESVPQDWREYAGIIHSEGKRLCKLVDDVLDLTRMEAGNMAYSLEPQDPNELVGIVVMTLTPDMEEKGHGVELDLADDAGVCRLDAGRYTQVLTNVISNAVKYTNPGGKIAIRSRRAEPFPGSSVPTLLVTVEDNGIGIAEENLGKVFSKFEMVEAVKNHTAGTGLSMAICKQIIEDGHHGKIRLESEPGAGTKVFIQTPVS